MGHGSGRRPVLRHGALESSFGVEAALPVPLPYLHVPPRGSRPRLGAPQAVGGENYLYQQYVLGTSGVASSAVTPRSVFPLRVLPPQGFSLPVHLQEVGNVRSSQRRSRKGYDQDRLWDGEELGDRRSYQGSPAPLSRPDDYLTRESVCGVVL
jgi:hypothetical protein